MFKYLVGQPSPGPRRNAANERQTKAQAKAEAEVLSRFERNLGEVLASPGGRHVIYELLCTCGIYELGYDEGEKIRYYAGRRSIGLEVLGALNAKFPKEFLTLQREAMLRGNPVEQALASSGPDATEEGDDT